MDLQKEIDSFPVRLDIPLQWGDMDAAQHVNNVRYLRWTESSRIAFFEKFGMGVDFAIGVAPILAWHDFKYIFPLTFPDTAIVTCGVAKVEANEFTLESRIYSTKYNRIAGISMQRIKSYDYQALAKVDLPQSWVEGLQKAQEK